MADIGPAVGRLGTCQQIAYTGSSVAISNPFGAQTYWVRLAANTNCHYKIGDGVQTAATTSPFLAVNTVETVKVQPGQQISAIRAVVDGLVLAATSGTLSVTELTN